MSVSETKKGEWLILSHMLFSGLSPVIIALSLVSLPSFIALGWNSLCASIFFAIILTFKGTWRELRKPILWRYSFFVTIFISVLSFGFTFYGLTMTTPGNAALIALFEIFTSLLFFRFFNREHLSFQYRIGALCMIGGAAIVLGRDFSGINPGDLYILAATFCGPVGNFFQQKARRVGTSEAVLFLRTIVATPIVFGLAIIWGQHASFAEVVHAWIPLCINGVFIFGFSKILWVEGIHRIPVTKANALSSVTPLVTLFFAWLFMSQVPSLWQLASFVPLLFGILLLTDRIKVPSLRTRS